MLRRHVPASRRVSPLRLTIAAVYLVAVLALLMLLHVGLTPDVLIFVLLGAAVVVGQAALFVRDWGVFLLVVILWQQTGGLATWAGFPLHLQPLVAADRAIAWPLLHGALPQVWLQRHLYRAGTWHWYDLMSGVVYGLHFPQPLLVGFALWLYDRALFRRFAAAFLVLAALAFVVYIVYPAVPPWMAGSPDPAYRRYHLIPTVVKIFDKFNYFVLQQAFGRSYTQLLHVDYNLTAAMPSLHAAFPILSALYLRKAFGRWSLLMLGYACVVWFSVVYMAEHWMIDVIVGAAFAVVAYVVVERTARAKESRRADQWSRDDAVAVVAAAAAARESMEMRPHR